MSDHGLLTEFIAIRNDRDALRDQNRTLKSAIKAAIENEVSLDSERGSTWHILNDALTSQPDGEES